MRRQQFWRWVRRLVQGLVLLVFVASLVQFSATRTLLGDVDWFMRLDPLSGLGACLAARELIAAFWPALFLLALALVAGRYFCGWVCPLGTVLDLTDRILAPLRGSRPAKWEGDFEHRRLRSLKYYLLIACLVLAVFGIYIVGFFDPLAIVGRCYVLSVQAHPLEAFRALLDMFAEGGPPRTARALLLPWANPAFVLYLLGLGLFAFVMALELIRRRFWCRYLCPLGAFYALASRGALTGRTVSDACIGCGRCVDACPTSCISADAQATLSGECILCLNCQAVCPTGAISFGPALPLGQTRSVSLTRRGALAALAGSVVAYPLIRFFPGVGLSEADRPIRPPLAGEDLEKFFSKCLRCERCMEVCPTGALQPTGLQEGLEGLWTPQLVPELGYCVYDCNACGQICASGAIPQFSLEEKHRNASGLAHIDPDRCIPWRGRRRAKQTDFVASEHNCGRCLEVCPVPGKAIYMRQVQTSGGELQLPYVREEDCVGCGHCEFACPVQGQSGIRVQGGFRRLKSRNQSLSL